MRNTVTALTLGLCSLPSLAASLAEQFTLIDRGADSALDTRLFSHDGVEIKAWIDGTRRCCPNQPANHDFPSPK
ncbi:hypothetical protein VO71_18060 [Aeromonas salmonicida subsp. smithia]|nr:hypothetical protein VO71_18060 [Aeromonas salmonicida subsp. smithia]